MQVNNRANEEKTLNKSPKDEIYTYTKRQLLCRRDHANEEKTLDKMQTKHRENSFCKYDTVLYIYIQLLNC